MRPDILSSSFILRKSIYILLLFVISCGVKDKKEAASKASDTSSTNSAYAIHLPQQFNDESHLPVMIFFDPHADGAFAISKYTSLAEQFGVILIGSNVSKNGMTFEETNAIARELVDEAKRKFHVDTNRIVLCGFSGGAKVALLASMSNKKNISGVIYCGAGLPPAQFIEAGAIHSPIGFAGVRDLNYTEVIQTDEVFQERNVPHALVEWQGKHEWPDSVTFTDAFYWIAFRTGKQIDSTLVQKFISENKNIESDPLKEWRRLKKVIAFLHGIADVNPYINAHEALIKTKQFSNAIEKTKTDFQEEMKLKQEYMRNMDEKDLTWWRNEVTRMKNIKGEKEVMYQRLLGYVSLACFGLSNAAMKQGDVEAAQKILTIYDMVDPMNPDKIALQGTLDAMKAAK